MTHLSLTTTLCLHTARYLGLDATRPEEELRADLARGGGGWRDERGPVSQRHGVRRRSCEWAVSRAVCRHWLTHRRLLLASRFPPPSLHRSLITVVVVNLITRHQRLSGSDLMSLLSPCSLNLRVTHGFPAVHERTHELLTMDWLACWPVLNKAALTLSNKHVYGNVPNYGFGYLFLIYKETKMYYNNNESFLYLQTVNVLGKKPRQSY